jgi:hypothetical protein
MFGVKSERGVILLGRFWTNQIPIKKEILQAVDSAQKLCNIEFKKWSSEVKISLAIAISFFISLSPAYFHYCNLTEADLFSTDLSFENPDQENPLVDQQKGSRVSVLSVSAILFCICQDLAGQSVPLWAKVKLPVSVSAP